MQLAKILTQSPYLYQNLLHVSIILNLHVSNGNSKHGNSECGSSEHFGTAFITPIRLGPISLVRGSHRGSHQNSSVKVVRGSFLNDFVLFAQVGGNCHVSHTCIALGVNPLCTFGDLLGKSYLFLFGASNESSNLGLEIGLDGGRVLSTNVTAARDLGGNGINVTTFGELPDDSGEFGRAGALDVIWTAILGDGSAFGLDPGSDLADALGISCISRLDAAFDGAECTL
jgi:hypothetical protein